MFEILHIQRDVSTILISIGVFNHELETRVGYDAANPRVLIHLSKELYHRNKTLCKKYVTLTKGKHTHRGR